MRRHLLALPAGALLLGLLAAGALAATIELGATTPSKVIAPSCPKGVSPAQCTIILTEVTALETIRDGVTYPTRARKAGQIVAFTVGLSRLSSNRKTALQDIKYLDRAYGGTTQAGITVLAPVGPHNRFKWKVVAVSPMFHLQPYLGQVVQFPLQTSIPVAAGDVVALTVPTWAPVLSIDMSSRRFAYRQSRRANCGNPPASNQSQTTVGTITPYGCDYPGTRVEYSVTEITDPVPPKDYVR